MKTIEYLQKYFALIDQLVDQTISMASRHMFIKQLEAINGKKLYIKTENKHLMDDCMYFKKKYIGLSRITW